MTRYHAKWLLFPFNSSELLQLCLLLIREIAFAERMKSKKCNEEIPLFTQVLIMENYYGKTRINERRLETDM